VHFWGNRGEEATIILKVPEGRRFWSDYILDHPAETFGGLEASLTYMDKVYAPRLIEVGYEKVEGDTSPCGSVCRKCTSLGRCGGCPALSLE